VHCASAVAFRGHRSRVAHPQAMWTRCRFCGRWSWRVVHHVRDDSMAWVAACRAETSRYRSVEVGMMQARIRDGPADPVPLAIRRYASCTG